MAQVSAALYPFARWRQRDDPCSRPQAGDANVESLHYENPLELLARKLDGHHRLTHLDREAILELPYRLRKLEAQSYTMREGDRPERCAVLISGFAFRHKLTGNGSRQIL